MSQNWEKQPTPLHTLHTPYPLRRISWRPDHPTELAIIPLNQPLAAGSIDPTVSSVSQGLGQDHAHSPTSIDEDAQLEIWDVRRHYVAKYRVPTRAGTAVDAIWHDGDTLVTTFQSGVFGQYDLKNRSTPLINGVPRQVTAWSPRGELAYAIDRFKLGEIPFDDL